MKPFKNTSLKSKLGCLGIFAIPIALIAWSIRNSYTWENSIRAKVPETWVLHRENRVGNLLKPWEWFKQPVTGLNYMTASLQLGESQYAVTIVTFNYEDPILDNERTREFDGSSSVFSYLIDLEKGEESFLGEFSITEKSASSIRLAAARDTAKKIPAWRIDEYRKSINIFTDQKSHPAPKKP